MANRRLQKIRDIFRFDPNKINTSTLSPLQNLAAGFQTGIQASQGVSEPYTKAALGFTGALLGPQSAQQEFEQKRLDYELKKENLASLRALREAQARAIGNRGNPADKTPDILQRDISDLERLIAGIDSKIIKDPGDDILRQSYQIELDANREQQRKNVGTASVVSKLKAAQEKAAQEAAAGKTYKSQYEVKAAVAAGRLSKEDAFNILRKQFGYK